jgi:hypothetical protein
MIKRISFATRRSDLSPERFAMAWREALLLGASAPDQVAPRRVAACTSMPEVLADPLYDGVGLEWFEDAAHVERYEAWLGSEAAEALHAALEEAIDLETSPLVLADEHIMRGAGWLEQRWRTGGIQLKHMAIAQRAPELSPAEFSQRWLGRSGTLGRSGQTQALVIPDEARGLAYVQNHPRPRASGDWPYDALNEVYFDELDGLERRIAFFDEHLTVESERDLLGPSWFIAATEELISRS